MVHRSRSSSSSRAQRFRRCEDGSCFPGARSRASRADWNVQRVRDLLILHLFQVGEDQHFLNAIGSRAIACRTSSRSARRSSASSGVSGFTASSASPSSPSCSVFRRANPVRLVRNVLRGSGTSRRGSSCPRGSCPALQCLGEGFLHEVLCLVGVSAHPAGKVVERIHQRQRQRLELPLVESAHSPHPSRSARFVRQATNY